jgi:hypothetical protein
LSQEISQVILSSTLILLKRIVNGEPGKKVYLHT